MARGPARNPDLLRFDAAGYVPAIYVAEGSGVVKVGQAYCATRRLQSLHHQYRRMGLTLGAFHIFPVRFVNDLHKAEQVAIKALQSRAAKFGRTREFFTGIAFDDAVRAVASSL